MDDKIIQIAAETLGTDIETVTTNYREIPEINAWYFWEPVRGGVSVIINSSYEKLSATSGVEYEEHLREFANGKRN